MTLVAPPIARRQVQSESYLPFHHNLLLHWHSTRRNLEEQTNPSSRSRAARRTDSQPQWQPRKRNKSRFHTTQRANSPGTTAERSDHSSLASQSTDRMPKVSAGHRCLPANANPRSSTQTTLRCANFEVAWGVSSNEAAAVTDPAVTHALDGGSDRKERGSNLRRPMARRGEAMGHRVQCIRERKKLRARKQGRSAAAVSPPLPSGGPALLSSTLCPSLIPQRTIPLAAPGLPFIPRRRSRSSTAPDARLPPRDDPAARGMKIILSLSLLSLPLFSSLYSSKCDAQAF